MWQFYKIRREIARGSILHLKKRSYFCILSNVCRMLLSVTVKSWFPIPTILSVKCGSITRPLPARHFLNDSKQLKGEQYRKCDVPFLRLRVKSWFSKRLNIYHINSMNFILVCVPQIKSILLRWSFRFYVFIFFVQYKYSII